MTDTQQTPSHKVAEQIRPVRAGDLEALKVVIDDSGLFPSELLDDMLAGYLAGQSTDEFWLTVDDGGPVAVAFYTPERMTEGTWNLLLIAVNPGRRSQGLGAALLQHVASALATGGERVLLVETSGKPDFERTRGFYIENGYHEEARIRDYYEAGDDKVIFWKQLADTSAKQCGGAGA